MDATALRSAHGDVYAFRAETPGDYSSGYFRLVMNGPGVDTTRRRSRWSSNRLRWRRRRASMQAISCSAQSGVAAENNIYWYDTSADNSQSAD